jgi:hypothetical protein
LNTIAIPRSVLDYAGRPAIRTAVDHLLSSGGHEMPEDLDDWSQVRAYHGALLSAFQVRAEHALLMMDISEAVWIRLLAGSTAVGRPLMPSEQATWEYDEPSPETLWGGEGIFHRTFHYPAVPGAIVDAGVRYDFDGGIQLHFAIWDTEGTSDVGERLVLPDPWEPEPSEYGYRFTRAGVFVPSSSAASFDLDGLAAAAGSAISAI